MPRDGAAARARLRDAALELYRERGYDATTAAQIAERAQVTERTYFRHFADKREVLFDGEIELRDTMTAAIAAAPSGGRPLELAVEAYLAAVPLFIAGRRIASLRAPIISATPALQERAHAKAAAITTAISDAIAARGFPDSTARLAAQLGAAVFDQAMRAWAAEPAADLGDLITRAADEAHRLL